MAYTTYVEYKRWGNYAGVCGYRAKGCVGGAGGWDCAVYTGKTG